METNFILDKFNGIFCNQCEWFNTEGYEEENKDIDYDMKFGWCFIQKNRVQECDYCSKCLKKQYFD